MFWSSKNQSENKRIIFVNITNKKVLVNIKCSAVKLPDQQVLQTAANSAKQRKLQNQNKPLN